MQGALYGRGGQDAPIMIALQDTRLIVVYLEALLRIYVLQEPGTRVVATMEATRIKSLTSRSCTMA
jgi:hypothetical protein